MTWLLSAPVQPFSIAAAVMLALVAIELIGLVAGAAFSEMLEGSPVGEFADQSLSWLNLGRVPFLVLLMLLLGLFAAAGMTIQAVAASISAPLPAGVAAVAAAAISLVATRGASRVLGPYVPRDETYALTDRDLIGLTGKVTVGPLESHAIGRIAVTDHFGNRHFPRVRPAVEGEVIEVGADVLIVDVAGRECRVILTPGELRRPAD